MKNKIFKAMLMMGLVVATATTSMAGSALTPVYAEEMEAAQGNQVVNGVLDFGKGSASININGNEGQSLRFSSCSMRKILKTESLSTIHSTQNLPMPFRQS